jgi:predicted double-glycine peptidase
MLDQDGMPRAGHSIFSFIIALSPLLANAQASAPFTAGTARVEMRVQSMKAMRDAGVVRQGHDYSCGSAALATIFTYGLNDRIGEEEILRAILTPLSPQELGELQKRGLSLFDLQKFSNSRGYKAQGFRVAAEQIAKLSRPVIVFVKPAGYNHFAVLKGVRGGRAFLADPSLGNVRMPLYRFLDMWADQTGRGVVFAVERAEGAWPASYALQFVAGETTELTTRQLLDVAAPHRSSLPVN